MIQNNSTSALAGIISSILSKKAGIPVDIDPHTLDINVSDDIIRLSADISAGASAADLSKILSGMIGYRVFISACDISANIVNGAFYADISLAGIMAKKLLDNLPALLRPVVSALISVGAASNIPGPIRHIAEGKAEDAVYKMTGCHTDIKLHEIKLISRDKDHYQLNSLLAKVSITEAELNKLLALLSKIIAKKLGLKPKINIYRLSVKMTVSGGQCGIRLITDIYPDFRESSVSRT